MRGRTGNPSMPGWPANKPTARCAGAPGRRLSFAGPMTG
jgi:hypothetical protein